LLKKHIGYSFFSLFLGLILNIIVVFIFFLSVLLIYSLLMVSVEARTFELGVLRMVGMTRARLAGLVLTQALFFAVPGIALGLPVAQALAILFARFLSNIAQIQVWPSPPPFILSLFKTR
jgi:ABC-type antimicrobial peptide transport system permease subunit